MKRNRKKQGISKPQRTPVQSLSSESTVQESKNRTESWTDNEKKVRKEFPGPKETIVQLRIAFDKKVYSEITEHVHKFFDIEVCGVLVGDFCEDENGSLSMYNTLLKVRQRSRQCSCNFYTRYMEHYS